MKVRLVGEEVTRRNAAYSIGEMLLALLYPMILGLERIETTQLLRQNGVFQYLTGLPSYPDATTLRRFLLRVGPTALPKLRASNLPFKQWAEFLPSPAQAVAIADRLVDDATILRFTGKPYRQPRDVHGAPLDGE